MENLITGIVVLNILNTTVGRDGKQYSKRYVTILDDTNSTYQFQIGWKCKPDFDLEIGQRICAKWILTQFGNNEVRYSAVEIVDIELLSAIRQGIDRQQPVIPPPSEPTVPENIDESIPY